jgi:hypothetical protein
MGESGSFSFFYAVVIGNDLHKNSRFLTVLSRKEETAADTHTSIDTATRFCLSGGEPLMTLSRPAPIVLISLSSTHTSIRTKRPPK